MKIEFENSVTRLSFLCRLPDIKIASINSRMCIVFNSSINILYDGAIMTERGSHVLNDPPRLRASIVNSVYHSFISN